MAQKQPQKPKEAIKDPGKPLPEIKEPNKAPESQKKIGQRQNNTLWEMLSEFFKKGEINMGRERFYGSFYRSFTLPSNINADKIEANFENGVLQISIPKTEISPGKQISIKEGKLLESKSEKEKK